MSNEEHSLVKAIVVARPDWGADVSIGTDKDELQLMFPSVRAAQSALRSLFSADFINEIAKWLTVRNAVISICVPQDGSYQTFFFDSSAPELARSAQIMPDQLRADIDSHHFWEHGAWRSDV